MRKTVRVIFEKEFEIDIDDDMLSAESLAEFGGFIGYSENVETNEDKVNYLFKFVARNIFDEDTQFVEGVGYAVPEHLKHFNNEATVTFSTDFEDIEVEII